MLIECLEQQVDFRVQQNVFGNATRFFIFLSQRTSRSPPGLFSTSHPVLPPHPRCCHRLFSCCHPIFNNLIWVSKCRTSLAWTRENQKYSRYTRSVLIPHIHQVFSWFVSLKTKHCRFLLLNIRRFKKDRFQYWLLVPILKSSVTWLPSFLICVKCRVKQHVRGPSSKFSALDILSLSPSRQTAARGRWHSSKSTRQRGEDFQAGILTEPPPWTDKLSCVPPEHHINLKLHLNYAFMGVWCKKVRGPQF